MTTLVLDQLQGSIRHHLRLGVGLTLAVLVGVGGWAAKTDIAGAVIAGGQVVVDTNVKKVQHPTGGIVGELKVRDGDKVASGDLLLKLDETVTRANLAIVSKGLDELTARRARLAAERDGASNIAFPPDGIARASEPALRDIMAGETRLLDLRATVRRGQTDQLRQRIAQIREEIGGQTKQATAKAAEIVLIKRELEGARDLWKRTLMPITKLTALEREATRLDGEHGAVLASIAQAKGKIAETEMQILQIERDFASEVAKELREIDAKIGELVERKVAAEDQLRRVDIRAPQTGRVHQLAVHTVGGVVTAGEPLLLIVPESEELSVEARIAPHEIDQLQIGQGARLRFTALNQRTTPEIAGTVKRIGADVTSDQRTGASYYTVRIAITEHELAQIGDVKLVPGMPVEVHIETPQRTVLSYLLKPMQDQMTRALREK
jgi:HlyD family secretion protein